MSRILVTSKKKKVTLNRPLTPAEDRTLMTLGMCRIAQYRHLVHYFSDLPYCQNRINLLQDEELVDGDFLQQRYKCFWLTQEGCDYILGKYGKEFVPNAPATRFVNHFLYRTDFFMAIRKYNIWAWTREFISDEMKAIGKDFKADAQFGYNNIAYYLEVVNEEKMKTLKERLNDYDQMQSQRHIVLYVKNKDNVKKNLKGRTYRYPITTFQFGEEINL